MINLAKNTKEVNARGINNMNLYAFLGDSNIRGGSATEYVGWPENYNVVSPRTKILFKDDRTSETATLRWLDYSTRSFRNRDPGGGTVGPETPSGGPYSCGIDNSFMYYMRVNSPKITGLLKWALGGTTLIGRAGDDNDWNPSSSDTSDMWRTFIVHYHMLHGQKAIDIDHYNPLLKAVLIGLGTNDCFTGVWNQASFIAAIPNFCTSLRRALGQPSLPIYWIQVRSDLSSHPSGDYTSTAVTQARDALAQCDGGSTPITGFHLLDFESTTTTVDGIHYDAESLEEMGLSIGATFLAL